MLITRYTHLINQKYGRRPNHKIIVSCGRFGYKKRFLCLEYLFTDELRTYCLVYHCDFKRGHKMRIAVTELYKNAGDTYKYCQLAIDKVISNFILQIYDKGIMI